MSESKQTVNLSIAERVAGLKVLNAFKGSLENLAILLEDVKQFTVSEAEWAEANLVKNPQGDGTENWQWDDAKVQKDIILQNPTAVFLKDEIKKKSDAGEITLADLGLASLNSKLVV